MLCQNCHKNEATIHVQQIIDGHIQSYHLCEACAAKKGADAPDLQGFNLAEVLFDIAGKVAGAVDQSQPSSESDSGTEVVCPNCGWSHQQFRKTGYLGCPECYRVFAPLVEGMLKNIHRGDRHLGKIPLSADTTLRKGHEAALLNRELESLRKELEEKIRGEEYEQAAVLRDRIQELTARIKKHGES